MGNNNHNNVTYNIYTYNSNYALCHLESVHLKACQIRNKCIQDQYIQNRIKKHFAFVLLRIKYASLPMPLSILNEASTCDRQESHPSGIAHFVDMPPCSNAVDDVELHIISGENPPWN